MLVIDQLRRGDRKLQVIAAGIMVGLVILLGGLWYVQVVSAKRFEADLRNQQYRTVRIPAIRGKILDRTGAPLAESRPNYALNVYLEELTSLFRHEYTNKVRRAYTVANPGKKPSKGEIEDLERYARYRAVSNIVQQVANLLGEGLLLEEKKFHRHYLTQRALPFPVIEHLRPEQVARLVEYASEIPGVQLEIQPLRTYPNGPIAAHILGHLKRSDASEESDSAFYNYRLPDFEGELGIEEMFDADLRGTPGLRSILVNNLNYRQAASDRIKPLAGKNVVLTLDLGLQRAVEQALASGGNQLRGAAIVIDVRNGDILAMASAPSFDPNAFISGISKADWEQLMEPKLRPMFNRATYGAYSPGSIFKIITAIAIFDAGVANPADPLQNPGYIMVGRRRIDDTAAPGEYDFERAFKRSSNTYFIHYGLKAGLAKILETGHRFSLGEPTGLFSSQEVSGYFPRYDEVIGSWSAGNTANVCIGQEITVTPLQMAVMTAAIANGGKVYSPRLVAALEPAQGDIGTAVKRPSGQLRHEAQLDRLQLDLIRRAMLADVEDKDGTGHASWIEGMGICGKTGTAQITAGRRVVDHTTWFASFAPFENPRHAVVVMVESGGSGGGTCAPIAKKIYKALQTLGDGGPAMAINAKGFDVRPAFE